MDGKLNKWHAVRVSDDIHDAIQKMPWEKRKAMNEKIKKLIEREIRQGAPEPDP